MELYKVYTGEEFNKLSNGKLYYKLTNLNEVHNEFQFEDGLNIDTVPFSPTGECGRGGLYFTDKENFHHWIGSHTYVRLVTLPDDAKIYIENNKYKTDKFILGERRPIIDDPVAIMSVLHSNPSRIQHIVTQTKELCEYVLSVSLANIQYIREPTEEMIERVLKDDMSLIRYIKKQTSELANRAIEASPRYLSFIENQTEELCEKAIRKDGHAIDYVKNKTNRLCMIAFQTYRNAHFHMQHNPDAVNSYRMENGKVTRVRC